MCICRYVNEYSSKIDRYVSKGSTEFEPVLAKLEYQRNRFDEFKCIVIILDKSKADNSKI